MVIFLIAKTFPTSQVHGKIYPKDTYFEEKFLPDAVIFWTDGTVTD